MWTSHGPIQGYNGQAFIDAKHQVIIHAEAFGQSQDYAQGPPVLDGPKANMRALGHKEDYFRGKILTADSNYHSTLNVRHCDQMGLEAYIRDRFVRKRDPRFATRRKPRKGVRLEQFRYDKPRDQYVCPNDKRLKLYVKRIRVDGMIKRSYVSDGHDCASCSLRHKCLVAKGGAQVSIGIHWH